MPDSIYSDPGLHVDTSEADGTTAIIVTVTPSFDPDAYPDPDPNAVRRAAVVLVNTYRYESAPPDEAAS